MVWNSPAESPCRPWAWRLPLLVVLGVAQAPFALAQPAQAPGSAPGIDAALARLQHGAARPRRVALSPDGTEVAWSAIVAGQPVLDVTPTGGGRETPIVTAAQLGSGCSGDQPAWSPDGSRLAFVVTCVARPSQERVYVWERTTGAVRTLSALNGKLSNLAWSRDGRGLLALFIANGTRNTGYFEAAKPLVGDLGVEAPEVSRLYRIDVASGRGAFLTPPNLHVFEYGTAARAAAVAIVAAPPPGDADWSLAKLYMTDDGGDGAPPAPPRLLVDSARLAGGLKGVQLAIPRLSPDGERVAFICGLMTDPTAYGGDLCMAGTRPHGAPPVDVTSGLRGSVVFGQWLDNRSFGFVETRNGRTFLVGWDMDARHPLAGRTVDLGETTVFGGGPKGPAGPAWGDVSYAVESQVMAFAMEGAQTPPEVYVYAGGALKALTRLNAGATPPTHTVLVDWDNEGRHIQGWLTFPSGYDPSRRYPLLVMVHGGPEWVITGHWGEGSPWSGNNAFWPDLGYFVFQPNPRGSFGQGESFTAANRRDIGYGDLRDILAGMDLVEARYPIDKAREGILGWSYGGCMAMFAPTQTHRFRAAVAGAGLSDWTSFYGETSFTSFTLPLFGATPYDDPAIYTRLSALTFVKQARTPTLLLYGERDGGAPPPQGQEFWEGLRTEGVPSDLVVYEGQGHHFNNADDEDGLRRSADWFAKYMPPG